MNDISCTIIEAIANVACDKSCSEKVKAYRIEALNSIHQQICFYQKEGFTGFLIEAIAQKKCDIAATITTKEEAEKIKKYSRLIIMETVFSQIHIAVRRKN